MDTNADLAAGIHSSECCLALVGKIELLYRVGEGFAVVTGGGSQNGGKGSDGEICSVMASIRPCRSIYYESSVSKRMWNWQVEAALTRPHPETISMTGNLLSG